MRKLATTIGAIFATLLLASCAREVEIRVNWFEIEQSQVANCESLIEALPSELGGETRKALSRDEWDTERHDKLAAIWGDPIIVFKCAVKYPDGKDGLVTSNESIAGIDWLVFPMTSGNRYNSTGLEQTVQVTIPEVYDATEILTELAPYLNAN